MNAFSQKVVAAVVILLVCSQHAPSGQEGVQIDPEPGPRQKPYSPADGQVVQVTPPPFIWVPSGKKSVYCLQISRSEVFSAESTHTYHGISRSVFVPCDVLPPGQWYWRYGIETGQGTVWGRPRPFVVPEDARPFPYPDWEQVIPEIPKTRPRLFFPGERLEQARHWAAGPLKREIARLVAACEREVGKELVAEPGYPPKGPEYGPWAVNVMRTTRPPMDMMESCALAWLLTGNRRLGEEAKRRLLHFFGWDPNGPTSFFGYDEPAMWMMMRGTRAYDWTYDLFTPEERTQVEKVMKIRAEQFYRHLQRLPFESSPYESHAGRLPGFLGECALAFIHEWPEAPQWLDYATVLYCTAYPAWGGDDGGWQEGPAYWAAYMQFALHYVVALRHATAIDLMQKPFFRNTPYYALYTATPYHQHVPFGDGQTGSPKRLGPVMFAFSTLLQSPYFRWYAEEARASVPSDVLTLATYDPRLEPRSPRELPPARFFPAVGLASFHTALGDRENDISFLFRSSPYGAVSHGHADQNAYVVEAFGRGLAIATGYYPWYGSPHHDQWTRSTKAVNSVLVDGQGQVKREWGFGGRLTAFASIEGYDYVEGEAAPAYGGRLERFRRHVLHLRPGVFVVFDDLRSLRPAQFGWLLHAYNRIHVDEVNQILRITNSSAAMQVHLLLPEGVNFSQTDRYEPEPELQAGDWSNTWHLTAATREPDHQALFLAVLLPYREGKSHTLPQVKLLQGAGVVGVVLVHREGDEDLVAFRTDPGKTAWIDQTQIPSRVFARGKRADGQVFRTFSHE